MKPGITGWAQVNGFRGGEPSFLARCALLEPAELTPEQYRVLRQKGTERAFSGALWDEHRPGVYRWLSPEGEVVYVGKSKSLRSRLLRALGDRSVFTASTDDEALKTIRVTEVEVVVTEQQQGAVGLSVGTEMKAIQGFGSEWQGVGRATRASEQQQGSAGPRSSSSRGATTKPGSSPGTAIVLQPKCEPIMPGLIRTLRPI